MLLVIAAVEKEGGERRQAGFSSDAVLALPSSCWHTAVPPFYSEF
jgi:hypothetical protein